MDEKIDKEERNRQAGGKETIELSMSSIEFDGNDVVIGGTVLLTSSNFGGFMGGVLLSSSLSNCVESIWLLVGGEQMRFLGVGVTKLTSSGEEGVLTLIIMESGVKSSSRGQHFNRASCKQSCIKSYFDLTIGGEMSRGLRAFRGRDSNFSSEFCLACLSKMSGRMQA